MDLITFIDTEIDPNRQIILDIGAMKANGNGFHNPSVTQFIKFLLGTKYICGHNILHHDIRYIGGAIGEAGVPSGNIIDTLFLSPLLFPKRPYHHLVKDDKLQSEDRNNPLNDSIKAQDLFMDEVSAFGKLDEITRQIYYLLLHGLEEFSAFFKCLGYSCMETDIAGLIRDKFQDELCSNAALDSMILTHPAELAYCLAIIGADSRYSITPPWVLRNYPQVERIMFLLRNRPCLSGCPYCKQALNIHLGLERFFGFSSFRTYGGEPLQEKAAQAAMDNKSILAVFPTGGGKSITFQVPALMSGETVKGLTVVISPLQSLMKDQVDNLESKGITEAVTINGLLDPIERAKSYERVENGSASLLYISPESLRSRTMERLLLGRRISRFVIDEAHCFSAWGQDFRVDYLYIGDFIRSLQERKGLQEGIPVSCFTATAKQKVIEDIRDYFKTKLSLDLVVFTTKVSRSNLHYKVFQKTGEDEKYQTVRDLIDQKNCPTIIYVSRTKKAYELAERLAQDGFNAKPYHGKMDVQEKMANQTAFIAGEVDVMVATSAFGMGVDKKDVGTVIHYEISDSLENYVQEAGRAGRDEEIQADCFVLFNEEDLSKHFILLNQTKLSIKEIQQIWKAIKEITKFRSTVSNSALEIARKAGWDDNVMEIETRVTTAIAALENAGYLKRQQNMPRIYANSILASNAQEAIDQINNSGNFDQRQQLNAARIIKMLFSSRSRKKASDEAPESRIDYISDHLGIVKEEVIGIVNLLREAKILADTKDLTAFIKRKDNKNRSLSIVESYGKIENFLLTVFEEQEKTLHIKELNEAAELQGCTDVTPHKIKTLINFWAIKQWIRRGNMAYAQKELIIAKCQQPVNLLKERLLRRHELAKFVVEYLYQKSRLTKGQDIIEKSEILVEFSVHELKGKYEASTRLFKQEVTINDIEDTLFYLSRIDAIKIEGGFMVVYNRLTIERMELDNNKRYTKDDYLGLQQFYENKVQQIHIVGAYAQKMLEDYKVALQFTEDYFQLNYSAFLRKYFPGSRVDELRLKMTTGKFRQLFGELSPKQLSIIKDNENKYIVVAAGPGSGKTRILVHKLASLLLMEDVKHEQLLMVTFSRAAATELKKRLLKLIGNAANYVEIKTFHSYCFDLLGKVGSLEKAEKVIEMAIEKIVSKEVEPSRITKTVLVIDEAQDMDQYEFELIKALMRRNEDMRVIAVGDDDQNIYGFRGSSSEYLEKFVHINGAKKYELTENYRSKQNLVAYTNQFVETVYHRLKETPIIARQQENGKIKVIHYQSPRIILPFIEDILQTELTGTTCVLTKTNEEALQVTGQLLKAGVHAKLIQMNEEFVLYNLAEVRFFLGLLENANESALIDEEVWTQAKRALKNQYQKSDKLELCCNIISEFELIHVKSKYKSDFKLYLLESRLEDFYSGRGETIFVSTIHKAKGKEFDNVFLMLENVTVAKEETKREIYVAMTRAKRNLIIHLNTGILDRLSVDGMEWIDNNEQYSLPDERIMHLTHKDINLGYFGFIAHRVDQLVCGDRLSVTEDGCLNDKGAFVLKFSKVFKERIKQQRDRGYLLNHAVVNFLVYWTEKESGRESLIILPNLYLRHDSNQPPVQTVDMGE